MSQLDLSSLQGTWRWQGSESLAYGRMAGGELKVAYCFGGNSRMLGQIRARTVPCIWVRQPHSEPVPAWAEKIPAQV